MRLVHLLLYQCIGIVKFTLSLLKSEDKLHLGIKNELVHFILLSVCIIFAA